MKWNMIEKGNYWSEDNRFHIFKEHNMWYLFDTKTLTHRSVFSMKMCKQIAEETNRNDVSFIE